MNRMQYLIIFRQCLDGKMRSEEIEDIMNYYNEYFDEAGAENEQSVIAELGSPQKLAAAVMSEYKINEAQREKRTGKKLLKGTGAVVLAICAAPIGLPIIIAILALLFAVMVVVVTVLASLIFAAIAIIASGVFVFIIGISIISSSIPTAIFYIGAGLSIIGISTIALIGVIALFNLIFNQTLTFVKRRKMKKRGMNNEEIL